MGVFFTTQPIVSRPHARRSLLAAYQSDRLASDDARVAADAALGSDTTEPEASGVFHPWRFLIAVLLFGALVAAGISTEHGELADSSKALFGFAGTIFGVVTALLSVESGQK